MHTFRHPLFEDNPEPSGGGGTAVAETPESKPAMPIAGGIPSSGTPAPEPKPSGFDWKGKIPDDAPPAVKKYGTWDKYGNAHASLQAEYEKEKKKAKPSAIPTDRWNQLLGEYYTNGALPEEVFAEIQQVTGLPPEFAAGVFEHAKAKRESFVTKADEEIKDTGATYAEIEAWMAQSGLYPADAIAGFMYLANRGDASWVKAIAADYVAANPEAVAAAGSSVPANKKAPARSGKPVGTSGPAHDGYSTREEYMAAIKEARSSGQSAAVQKVITKLQKTPEKVRATWGPIG